jgi:hypothetical protein
MAFFRIHYGRHYVFIRNGFVVVIADMIRV